MVHAASACLKDEHKQHGPTASSGNRNAACDISIKSIDLKLQTDQQRRLTYRWRTKRSSLCEQDNTMGKQHPQLLPAPCQVENTSTTAAASHFTRSMCSTTSRSSGTSPSRAATQHGVVDGCEGVLSHLV